ncbi:hypothetical protein ILUMI_23123 [Ignelater luminosus]|uniref:Uncharacterized protein n=1 Tax=Ignelater luminosus TaxID=2038154 RepID=A0A8K0CD36_IGNLU|nr:hypothetical protein ILUMI_23123 [Ignelater luminosus]
MALSILSKLCKLSRIKSLFVIAPLRTKPQVFVRVFSMQPKCAPILNTKKNNLVFHRTFFQFFKRPNINTLKQIDGIPPEYILIYRNAMDRYLLSAQIVSTVSAIIVCAVVFFYSQWEFELNTQKWRMDDQPNPMENEGFIYATCFVTLCVLLHLIVTKMPIRIYNYPRRQKYVFIFYGILPTTKKRVVCKVNEVIKLEENGLLPWKDSRYEIVQKQNIIMLEHFFRKPSDLNIMLGYEKQAEDYD